MNLISKAFHRLQKNIEMGSPVKMTVTWASIPHMSEIIKTLYIVRDDQDEMTINLEE